MHEKKFLKPLPLSMRERKRYISFQLIPLAGAEKFPEEAVRRALGAALLQLFGEVGLARKGYRFILFDYAKGTGIIKCNHSELEDLKSGVLFLKGVNGKAVVPKILRVSGTIKKLKSRLKVT